MRAGERAIAQTKIYNELVPFSKYIKPSPDYSDNIYLFGTTTSERTPGLILTLLVGVHLRSMIKKFLYSLNIVLQQANTLHELKLQGIKICYGVACLDIHGLNVSRMSIVGLFWSNAQVAV